MQLAYTMTSHAMERMMKRRIDPLDAIKALSHSPHYRPDGTVHYFDPQTRVKVIVNPVSRVVITVYKAVKER